MTDKQASGGAGYADEVREHSFDGIQEFDNRLPQWWLWTFYGACIFAFFYWTWYQVLPIGKTPYENFQAEMAAAKAKEEALAASQVTDEQLIALSKDQDAVARGDKIFHTPGQCMTCHSANAGGMAGLGANLTDKFWIHGGKPTDIFHTVTEGVPGTAMIAWKMSLDQQAREDVVAYVLTLRNTNVEGGQPPKGEPYEGQ